MSQLKLLFEYIIQQVCTQFDLPVKLHANMEHSPLELSASVRLKKYVYLSILE